MDAVWNAVFVGTKRARMLLKNADAPWQQEYTLHSTLRSLPLAFEKFKGVHTAIIEAPLASSDDFCSTALNLTIKLTKKVKRVAMIAQPTVRRVAQKTAWITLERN